MGIAAEDVEVAAGWAGVAGAGVGEEMLDFLGSAAGGGVPLGVVSLRLLFLELADWAEAGRLPEKTFRQLRSWSSSLPTAKVRSQCGQGTKAFLPDASEVLADSDIAAAVMIPSSSSSGTPSSVTIDSEDCAGSDGDDAADEATEEAADLPLAEAPGLPDDAVAAVAGLLASPVLILKQLRRCTSSRSGRNLRPQ